MTNEDRAARGGVVGAPFGGAYLIAVVGAAVYFVGMTEGFWGTVLALLKALVWPAFLVYGLLDLLEL